jgi:nicotinate phosphoribosyltransferase
MGKTSALLTDRYEISGDQVSLHSGAGRQHSVFEVFARDLPPGRRYGIFAGLGRLLGRIEDFEFGPSEMAWLKAKSIGDEQTWAMLKGHPFQGDIWAYREGEVYFPYSPLMRIEGSFAECLLLETLTLSVLNWDSGIASTAARMVSAAKGRALIEMASRRVHEEAAVAVARAAYIAGFTATSNLEAGRTWGVPTAGTAQHALTLAHENEIDAFVAQVEVLGEDTTLLADTYDWRQGLRNAVLAGGQDLGAVRIDLGGDLEPILAEARGILESLGATKTRIVCSGRMDEFEIERLKKADAFGVGERLVFPVGGGSPGFTYKLVQIEDRAVAKRSENKGNYGGRKTGWRLFDSGGIVVAEESLVGGGVGRGKAMHVKMMAKGQRIWEPSTEEIRAECASARRGLSAEDLSLVAGAPRIVCQMRRPEDLAKSEAWA